MICSHLDETSLAAEHAIPEKTMTQLLIRARYPIRVPDDSRRRKWKAEKSGLSATQVAKQAPLM